MKDRAEKRYRDRSARLSDRGIALPLVLWTITILSTVVFSLALAARTDVRMTSHFRSSIEKKLLAEAGVERGLFELAYRGAAQRSTDEQKPWKVDGSAHQEKLGKGTWTVSIVDESGKISINGLTDGNSLILKNFLTRLGANADTADTIVDSILDWKDTDDLHRLNGAENDYYMSLPVPYKARNGDFQTPEELLLVKGMTEEIFFGTDTAKGLSSYITVYSKHSGVNLEAASREVIMSLPEMSDALADSIIAYRDSTPVWNASEAQALLGPVIGPIRGYIGAPTRKIYTVTSQGKKDGEKAPFSLVATLKLDAGGATYLYYKSPAGRGE
jgi:general secretion pathway protein K